MVRALYALTLFCLMFSVALADPPRQVVRVQTYSYPQYQYQGYSYYSPPKVTYLLIVPAPEPKAEAKEDPSYLKKKPEALKAPPPKKAEPLKAADDTPPELAKEVIAVFANHCVSCHGATNPKKGLTLLAGEEGNWKLAPLTKNQWWEVYGRVNAGQMPPAAAKDAAKALPEADLLPLLKRAGLK